MGLSWSSQLQKLKRQHDKFECVDINTPTNGGSQEMLCVPIRKLNGWLFGVNPTKVHEDIRETVVKYQEECFQVLHDYWTKGIAINDRLINTSEQLKIRQAVAAKVQGVQRHYSTLYSRLYRRFDIASYKDLPVERLGEALDMIDNAVLSGEYIPKAEPLPTKAISINFPSEQSPYQILPLNDMLNCGWIIQLSEMMGLLTKAAESGTPVIIKSVGRPLQELKSLQHLVEMQHHTLSEFKRLSARH